MSKVELQKQNEIFFYFLMWMLDVYLADENKKFNRKK